MVEGRVRKYYAITGEGREALTEIRPKIAELVAEVLEEQGSTALPEEPDDRTPDESFR